MRVLFLFLLSLAITGLSGTLVFTKHPYIPKTYCLIDFYGLLDINLDEFNFIQNFSWALFFVSILIALFIFTISDD